MRAWMIGAALSMSACGVGVEPQAPEWSPPEAASPQQTVSSPAAVPGSLERVPALPRERTDSRAQPLAQMPTAPFVLGLEATGFADEGATAHALAAAPSCGWWVTAKGSATIANGGFSLELKDALMGDSEHGVFVYVDRDGDGSCDTAKGDLLFMTTVQGDQPLSLALDPAALTPAQGWECMLFEYY